MQTSLLQQINRLLLGILLFFSLLYLGRPFLIPVSIGLLFSILLLPVASKLEEKAFSRTAAAGTCIIGLVIIIFALSFFLTNQVIGFINDLPAIKGNLENKLDSIQDYIDDKLDMPREEQARKMDVQVSNLFQRMGNMLTTMLYSTGTLLMDFFIIALYAFFFISYRRRFKNFILKLISKKQEGKADEIFEKVANVANSYIVGVSLVVLILAACNTIALSLIGIRQALFFGVLAGLLNIIPFIGSLVGSAIPVLVLLLTRDSYSAALTAAIYFLGIQLVESYFLTPNITGNKVKLNPMATIMALMLGALVWGVAGMILFIPYLGVLKVLFDNVESLKPFGAIIGNEQDIKERRN
ncbi:AI-2E family transporter [Aridibaculum aurantiacum]|uniref:AI-2E family transporter n=1 Tax=Aridibaculum aurantiacum TaxID=2810307 RepID=UPI001A9760ED|nr:AI-2E family transporter [Aridibaculum aurantiacum]